MRCSPSPIETFRDTLDMEEASIAALLLHSIPTSTYIQCMFIPFRLSTHQAPDQIICLRLCILSFSKPFFSQNALPSPPLLAASLRFFLCIHQIATERHLQEARKHPSTQAPPDGASEQPPGIAPCAGLPISQLQEPLSVSIALAPTFLAPPGSGTKILKNVFAPLQKHS